MARVLAERATEGGRPGAASSNAAAFSTGRAADSGAEASDLEILAPDREIEIGGEKVTVRELTFGEQLRHGADLAAITEGLRPLLKPGNEDNIGIVLSALVVNAEALVRLIALSTGKTADWVRALPGEAGETLAMLWWSAHCHFFIRRLVLYPAIGGRQGGQTGGGSSPPSSATATEEAN